MFWTLSGQQNYGLNPPDRLPSSNGRISPQIQWRNGPLTDVCISPADTPIRPSLVFESALLLLLPRRSQFLLLRFSGAEFSPATRLWPGSLSIPHFFTPSSSSAARGRRKHPHAHRRARDKPISSGDGAPGSERRYLKWMGAVTGVDYSATPGLSMRKQLNTDEFSGDMAASVWWVSTHTHTHTDTHTHTHTLMYINTQRLTAGAEFESFIQKLDFGDILWWKEEFRIIKDS